LRIPKWSLTTDNVQGAESDVLEDVEGALAHVTLQLVDQHSRLTIEHVHKVVQDPEVKGRGQHFPPRTPFFAGAKNKTKTVTVNTVNTYILKTD
jgi:hypothetical protein